MEMNRIRDFQNAIAAEAASLLAAPCRKVTLVHHNDTDGITSGAILRKSLTRAGFSVEHIPIERIHPALLPAIHTPERPLILYADLGGQAADLIGRQIRNGARVLIIDHHLPAAVDLPSLRQVNPEQFGIDGDSACAAAAAACLFALALGGGNEELAALAVLGAAGDHQMSGGRCEGPNALLLDIAAARGDLRPRATGDDAPWALPRFQGRSLREAVSLLNTLSVNGYYRRGSDLALAACVDGLDERVLAFEAEMAAIERDRFSREIARIRREGIPQKGPIAWIDVVERFHPLGLKAIGLFCEEIVRGGTVDGECYVVGSQRLVGENPYLGGSVAGETKVSFRVTPALRASIERGERPDLMRLVPGAAEGVGGFAEACHRFAAACTIPGGREEELLAALADRLRAEA